MATEHILNFAIGLDDDAIIKTVQETAVKKITDDLEKGVIEHLFSTRYYNSKPYETNRYDGKLTVSRDASLQEWARDLMVKTTDKYRSEIIERVSVEVATKLCRSQKFKDSVLNKIEEVEG